MGKRLRYVLTGSAWVATVAGLVCGCDAEGFKRHQDIAYTVTEPVTALVVHGGAGRIRVTAGAGPVSVTEHQGYQRTPPVARHRVVGSALILDFGCPDDGCGVGYEITVPAATAVKVDSDDEVDLTGLAGDVQVVAEGGIHAKDLASPTVDIQGRKLGVDVSFAVRPVSVKLDAGSGGVFLTLPDRGPYRILKAKPDAGGLTIDVDQRSDATSSIWAHAVNGGVRIRH